jgi:hypothetical protein
MIRRSTWITLALFAWLLAFAIYWTAFRAPQSQVDSTPAPMPPWSISLTEITGLKIEYFGTGEAIELSRDPEGGWLQSLPLQGAVDGELVEQSMSWLIYPSVSREIDMNGDLTQFGLSEPRASVTIHLVDGSNRVLLIGDDTPTSNLTYTLVPDSPTVLLMSQYNVNSILDLVGLELAPTPTPEGAGVDTTETAVP